MGRRTRRGGGGGPLPSFNLRARVTGFVTTEDGEPVAPVTMRITTFRKNGVCGTEPVGQVVETVNEENGFYVATLTFTESERFLACLTIMAIPLDGLGLQTSTKTNREVEVRPLDQSILTLQEDFVLVPRRLLKKYSGSRAGVLRGSDKEG